LIEAISELPDPNRDTLAYLCLHLQKVAYHSAENKMPVKALATCVCLSILNSGSINPLNSLGRGNEDVHGEVDRLRFVLEQLLLMPAVSFSNLFVVYRGLFQEFWSDYLNMRTVSTAFASATPTTHFVTNKVAGSRADCSVLGPVSSTPPQGFTPSFSGKRRIRDPLF
jgi:hypothetical protein